MRTFKIPDKDFARALSRTIVLLLLAALLGCAAPVPPAAAPAEEPAVYHAVIDAGSSGTRVHLYRVTPGPYPKVDRLLEARAPERDGRLADYVDPRRARGDAGAAGPKVIGPLLDHVRTQALARFGVPPQHVRVDLLATGGMRHAALRAPGAPEAIDDLYRTLRSYIAGRGFVVGEVRTADGAREEALWSWLSLNDQRDVFRTGARPLGLVEIGGASMQVSFATHGSAEASEHIHRVAIGGKTWSVFARSYLGLGVDDARRAMRTKAGPAAAAVCFPTGMRADDDAGDVIAGTVVKLAADGRFDRARCASLYADTIASADPSDLARLTDADDAFIGTAAVHHTLDFWRLNTSPQSLAETTAHACSRVENFPGIATRVFSQRQCANAVYVDELLTGASGLFARAAGRLTESAAPTLTVAGGAREAVGAWTRGYLLERYGR